MKITLNINHLEYPLNVPTGERLLDTLRKLGIFSVKSGGCEKGECGACAVLFDGRPVNSCTMLTAQAEGHLIETVESMGEHPEQGWKKTEGLHIIQQSFVETGAIQCGYCTPAMVLVTKSLLEKNLTPTEQEVRDALSGVLCRCTGYLKPVQAVMRAAAILRGEYVPPVDEPIDVTGAFDFQKEPDDSGAPQTSSGGAITETRIFPKLKIIDPQSPMKTVGHAEPKVDAVKLVQGKPAFTADFEKRDMLGWIFLVGLTDRQLQERIRVTDRRYDIINNPDGRKQMYLGSLSNLHIGKQSTPRKMLRRCISQDWGIVVTSEQWNGYERFKFRHSSAQLPGGPDLFHKICKGFARKYRLPYQNVEEKILVGTLVYHLIGMYYRPGSRTDTTLCCSRSMRNVTVVSKYQANQIMGTYKTGVIQTNSFLADVKDSSIDNVDKSFFVGEKKSGIVLAEIHYQFSEARLRKVIDGIDVQEEIRNYKERSRFSDEFYQKLGGVIEIKDQFLVNVQNQPWIRKS